MGIPGLYRWLIGRYPNTVCRVAQTPCDLGADIDLSQPNPNGVEFDNLYIDLNGIIHPCFNPSELAFIPPPESFDDIFICIQKYIDKIFSIIRPRKLLFLALDGVAPRAKMNHQRIRRFRSAKEAAHAKRRASKMDSNVITPGTQFMELLSFNLKSYVDFKINNSPEWQNISVILSDSTVVGEGEYKIMSFIRSQRNQPDYDPNTRHCVHGMDADLIMLSLATHEIHFSILREVTSRFTKHIGKNHKGGRFYPQLMPQLIHEQKFEFFNIWVLREYLEIDLLPNVEGTDFERLIDDFVFFCIFAGNDFIPSLPSLDIYEGGIEVLMIVYQEEFVKMGYLTNAPEVNLKSMEHFLQALSSHENAIFFKRRKLTMAMVERQKMRRGFQHSDDQASIVELQSICKPDDDVELTTSKVTLHTNQTILGYYFKKFDCKSDDIDRIRRDAVLKYTEGVSWIMHYYYQGLCSWQWFYPYHYAPLASDFCGLDKIEINFTLGQPLKPLNQLLGVLPATSAHALPLFYSELMTKSSSPILDFYPKDAEVDMNGKKHEWQGVCKLPFIDASRLLSEALKVESTLTDDEKQRNRFGKDQLFVHCRHPLSEFIKEHLLCDPSSKLQIQITYKLSGGVNGYVCISDKLADTFKVPVTMNLEYNNVISVGYKCPSHAHIPKLLCGVIRPPKILRCSDAPYPPVVWHANVSQSIVFESSAEKIQKKWEQDANKATYGTQNGCTSEKILYIEKLTDQIEQKDKQQVKCEKASSNISSRGKHESPSLDGEPKRKQKKEKRRRIRGDKLEAQLDLVEVSEKPLNKMEHVKGEDITDHLVERSIGIQVGNKESLIIPSVAEGEGVSRKIAVEVGENLRNTMECDLVKGQEINISCEDKRKEEKSVSVGVDEIGGVEVDENMSGFPVSEKKTKKTKKRKKHVNDEQDEEKKKKQAQEKKEKSISVGVDEIGGVGVDENKSGFPVSEKKTKKSKKGKKHVNDEQDEEKTKKQEEAKEEKSVSVGVDAIGGVGVDENMSGFPVSEKKTKKSKKGKKHVNDEQDEEKTKKQAKAKEEKSVSVCINEIGGVGKEENTSGFPVSEKKTKKRKEHVNDEQDEEKTKKLEEAKEEKSVSVGVDENMSGFPVSEKKTKKSKKHVNDEQDGEKTKKQDEAKEEKSVSVGVDEIGGVGVDENLSGFPVSEKKTKKRKKHVNDEQDEEKTKKQAKASEKPERLEKEQTHKRNQVDEINNDKNIPRGKETENDDVGKSQRKRRKRVKEDFGVEEPAQGKEVPIAAAKEHEHSMISKVKQTQML